MAVAGHIDLKQILVKEKPPNDERHGFYAGKACFIFGLP